MRSLRPLAVVVLSASLLGMAVPASAAPTSPAALAQTSTSISVASKVSRPVVPMAKGFFCRFITWCY